MADDHTNLLIERLVGDLHPVRRRRPAADAAMLAACCAIELALFLTVGTPAKHIHAATAVPSFWWRLSSLGVLTTLGSLVAILSFDPARSPRPGLRWLALVVMSCLAAGVILNALTGGVGPVLQRLDWRDGIVCVGTTVLLSLPPLTALGLLMHRGASTDLPGTSLAVGAAAAAWGAFVYVFACPDDDPLYLLVWYGIGCGFITLLARASLPVLNRW